MVSLLAPMTSKITYYARWRELLVGKCGEHSFAVELTMGTHHVYFPTEQTWQAVAPGWAQGLWSAVKASAEVWADKHKMPITVDDQAWVDFEYVP